MPDVKPAIYYIKSISEAEYVITLGKKNFIAEISISVPEISSIDLSLVVSADSYALAPEAIYSALRKMTRSLQIGIEMV